MIKPGDIIEWVYKKTNEHVNEDECLWSSTSELRCQIGSGFIHTCIARDGETITWLNFKGLFHTRADDMLLVEPIDFEHWVVPRVKK